MLFVFTQNNRKLCGASGWNQDNQNLKRVRFEKESREEEHGIENSLNSYLVWRA